MLGPGTALGHFRLLEQIGVGGMGVVFRAHDEKLGRDVAIKVLPSAQTGDPPARARLIREARLASSLNHPGICTIYEVSEEGDRAFIAMEMVEGQRLGDAIPAQGMGTTQVLRIGTQIAAAVTYAHEHGVIHRDLKTSNVMVMPDGRTKVLDFGLARRLPTENSDTAAISSVLTETGAVVGTTHYLSPEILRGVPADSRSDIWALGVVLYEMASGALPFPGRTRFEVTAGILQAEPIELPVSVPSGLRAIVRRCLEKEPGQRYQHAAEVRAALEALTADPTAATGPARSSRASTGRGSGTLRPLALGAGAVLAIATVTAVLIFGPIRGCPGGGVIRSLAVLPLANLSGDPQQDYFADGMTDELISTFTRVGALRVISRTSVMGYKLHPKPAKEIARELGVQALLEGSVRKFADRVKITLALVQASGGRNLWSQSYERDGRDVLALQSEVAQAVVSEIRMALTPKERERLQQSRRVDPEAHELLLRGRHRLYYEEMTRASAAQALEYFERAIEIDPGYADAYVATAQALYMISNFYVPPDLAMPKIRAAASKALELDPNLAEAHSLIGVAHAGYEWNWARAEPEFKRAIELNPGAADPHFLYGYWLLNRGLFGVAQRELDLAVERDPMSTVARWIQAWPSFYQRRYEETTRRLEEQIASDSTLWMPFSLLGETLEQQGNLEAAARTLTKARALGGNPWVIAALARVYAKMDRRDSTAALLRDLDELSRQLYVTPYGHATVYMALGDRNRAFALLDLGVKQRNEDISLLMVDPRVDPLRSDPRFGALIDRIGFWK